jgi:hypothetical protein
MLRSPWVTVALTLGIASAASATPFVPPPVCPTATLDVYLRLPSNGCSVGGIGFGDFAFSVVDVGGNATPITASDILVTPSSVGSTRSLTFSSPGFSVVGDEFVTYRLAYASDPHPIIRGFRDALDAESPTAPGFVTITTNLCLGGVFDELNCLPPATPAFVSVFHAGTTSDLVDSVSFAPLALLGVINTIELRANGANADFTSFTNSEDIVPEPTTWMLIGSGLSAIGLLRARGRRGTDRGRAHLR